MTWIEDLNPTERRLAYAQYLEVKEGVGESPPSFDDWQEMEIALANGFRIWRCPKCGVIPDGQVKQEDEYRCYVCGSVVSEFFHEE